MAQVIWRSLALRDLQSIADFIGRDSPKNAERTIQRILASTRRLQEFPRSGRKVPDSLDDGIRQIVSRSYRVFYRIDEKQVVIIGVRHGAMELKFEDSPHD